MKPIYWALIILGIAVIIFFVIRRRSQNKASSAVPTMKDLSGFDPVAVRNALNTCELTYNTDLEVNNCAYQKLMSA